VHRGDFKGVVGLDRKKIVTASSVNVIGNMLYLGLGVLVNGILGRLYGPGGLGLYTSFLLFVNLYSTLAVFGMPMALSKTVAEYERQGAKFIGQILTSALMFTGLTSLVVGGISYFVTPLLAQLLGIETIPKFMAIGMFLSLTSWGGCQIIWSFYQGTLQFTKSTMVHLLPLMVVSFILLVNLTGKSVSILEMVVLGYVVSGIISLSLVVRDGFLISEFSLPKLLSILKLSFPLLIISYAVFVSTWADKAISGVLFGVEQIGLITSVMVFIQAARMLPRAISEVLIPVYSKLSANGQPPLRSLFESNVKVMSLLMSLFVFSLYILAEPLIILVYGSAFTAAVPLLQILSFALLAVGFSSSTTGLLTGTGRTITEMALVIAEVVAQLFLLFLLGSVFGVIGVALANTIAPYLGLSLRYLSIRRVMPTKTAWVAWLQQMMVLVLGILAFVALKHLLGNVVASIVSIIGYFALILRSSTFSENIKPLLQAYCKVRSAGE